CARGRPEYPTKGGLDYW
nr:immunoglobulin heavy chain junction region [Macaca mulatta]MOV53478.1 immunoglobulin heavy chain junction region [Macaca mulatta]MOV53518.1 immunoglobulin heavy chain junction region [Macaca mulatta]MOV53522.1 immunoglobulin heavy chain junction region [Macaca mulatta]MOV53612.1 immunoglobulin heavy chain junction region [Macaca mulatta]